MKTLNTDDIFLRTLTIALLDLLNGEMVLTLARDDHKEQFSVPFVYNYGTDEGFLKDFYIDGKDESLICYMNHSSKPNVKIIWEKHGDEIHIVFVANQIIDECEELFIDYGEEYWAYARKQNIRPEGRQCLITEYFI